MTIIIEILKGFFKADKRVSLVDYSYHETARYTNINAVAIEFSVSKAYVIHYLNTNRIFKAKMSLISTKKLGYLRKYWLKNRELELNNAHKRAKYLYGNDAFKVKQHINNFILNLR